MYSFKIYSGDHVIIREVTISYDIGMDLIGDGQAYGYVCVGDTLKPFCENSEVDMDTDIPDVTNLFKKTFKY